MIAKTCTFWTILAWYYGIFLHGKPDILGSNVWHSQPQGLESYLFGRGTPVFAAVIKNVGEKVEKMLVLHG